MLVLLLATFTPLLRAGYTCDSTVPGNETNTLPYDERGPVVCFRLQYLADVDEGSVILGVIDGERVVSTYGMYYHETDFAVNLSLCTTAIPVSERSSALGLATFPCGPSESLTAEWRIFARL